MKEVFVETEIIVIVFNNEDVICTSEGGGNDSGEGGI